MFCRISRAMLCCGLTLMLIPRQALGGQPDGEIIAVSPKVGEVVDRQERDEYRLFRSIAGFESAVFRLLPDGTYAIHIAFFDNGVRQTQDWRISQREFVEDYRNRIDKFDPDLGAAVEMWKSPMVKIDTEDGAMISGSLRMVEGDSLVLIWVETQGVPNHSASQDTLKVHFNDICRLSFPRKSTFAKNIALGLPLGGIGAVVGLASGDDPPGFFSMTAGEKAVGLGLLLWGTCIFVGGSLGALRGVDVDIPWQRISLEERRVLLAQVGAGQYRSRCFLRAVPWVGVTSPPRGERGAVFGGRLRCYLTPRSGLELAYGRSAWTTQHSPCDNDSRQRVEYFSGCLFIATSWKRVINPFLGWGLGRVTSKRTGGSDGWEENDHGISLNLYGGVELPVTRWLSLEGRAVDVWELGEGGHLGVQLALSLGPDS